MFGEHAAFILPSYVVTGLALVGTTAVIWFSYRIRKKELETLEQAGITRRSEEKQ